MSLMLKWVRDLLESTCLRLLMLANTQFRVIR